MAKKKRTSHSVILCIEEKIIKHGSQLINLQKSVDNHLKHHEEKAKEKRKLHWAIFFAVLSAALMAGGSLIVGLVLLRYSS